MSQEFVKYLYRLSGNVSVYEDIADKVRAINGVMEISVQSDGLMEVKLFSWASEYDFFCATNEICEQLDVDFDYAQTSEQEDSSIVDEEVEEIEQEKEIEEDVPKIVTAEDEKKIPDDEVSWKKKYLGNLIEIGISALLLLISVIFNFTGNTQSFMCLIAFAVVGYEIVWDAISSIYRKKFFHHSVFILVAIVALLFVTSYQEAAFVTLLFELQIVAGKILNDRAEQKIKSKLFFEYQILDVNKDGDVDKIFANEAKCGEEFTFTEGQLIPFDCEVIQGNCVIQNFNVTGIKSEVPVSEGHFILGGSKVTNGKVSVAVKNTVVDSFSHKLYEKVSQKIDTISDKFSKFISPISVLIGVIVAFVLPFLSVSETQSYSSLLPEYAYLGISLVAICNMFIYSNIYRLGYKSALNRALSMGAFVLDEKCLISFAGADSVAFCEKGAITNSQVKVEKVVSNAEYKGKLSSLIENLSLSYNDLNDEVINIQKDGLTFVLGDFEQISKMGIAVKKVSLQQPFKYVVINGKVVGAVSFENELKKNTVGAIKELKAAGIKSYVVGAEDDMYKSLSGYAQFTDETNVENCVLISDVYKTDGQILFDSINGNLEKTCATIIPNGDVKSVAKLIKLAKRLVKRCNVNRVLPIIFKILCVALTVVMYFVANEFYLWVALIVDSMVNIAILLNEARNEKEVY